MGLRTFKPASSRPIGQPLPTSTPALSPEELEKMRMLLGTPASASTPMELDLEPEPTPFVATSASNPKPKEKLPPNPLDKKTATKRPEPKTDLGKQMSQYWEKGSVRPNRKDNTLEYTDSYTGDRIRLENLDDYPIPAQSKGDVDLQKYLLQNDIANLPRTYADGTTQPQYPGQKPKAAAVPSEGAPSDLTQNFAQTFSSKMAGKPPPPMSLGADLTRGEIKPLSKVAPATPLPATPSPAAPAAGVDLGKTQRGMIPYTTRSGEASSGSSVEREGVEVSPEDQAKIRQAAEDQQKQQKSVYEKMMGSIEKPPTDVNRRKIAKEYRESVDREKKAQMWDNIITALGKITAGGIGLGGLGVGGKQLIEPGLDISKYYETGKPYDVAPGMEAAKNVMDAKLGEAGEDIEMRKAEMAMLQQLAASGNKEGFMEAIKLLAPKFRTQQTQSEEAKTGAGVTEDPSLAAKRAQGAKPKELREETSSSEARSKNEERYKLMLKGTGYAPNSRAVVKERFNPTYSTSTDNLLAYGEKLVQAENPKLKKTTNEAEYWKAVDDKLLALSTRYFNVPQGPNTSEYSLWWLETKMPMDKALGGPQVIIPQQTDVVTGDTTGDIFLNRNSAFNVVKSRLEKDPNFSKLPGDQKLARIIQELKKPQY